MVSEVALQNLTEYEKYVVIWIYMALFALRIDELSTESRNDEILWF